MDMETGHSNQWNIVKASGSEALSVAKESRDVIAGVLNREKIKLSPKEIQEVLKEREVKTRITLVRHYPHEKGKDLDRYNELIEKLEFWHTDDEKIEFSTLSNKIPCYSEFDKIEPKELAYSLENIFSQKNTIVIFDDTERSSKRVINTVKDLQSEKMKKRFPNLVFVSEWISLPWSDKTKSFDEDLTTCAVAFWDLIKRVKNEFIRNDEGMQNIVIIWNRSYCQWFLNAQENEKMSAYSAVKLLEEDWYLYIEYNSKKWLVKNTKDMISVTPKNYKDLTKIFSQVEHDSIIDFQNKLNVCFLKWIYKYGDFLFSDNEDLRIFCVMCLIQRWKTEELNKFFNTEKLNISSFWNLSSREKTIINYYFNVYKDVLKVRSRSLDKRIKDWEDINPHFNFSNEKYQEDILKLITTWKPIKYIEWKAWAWKSFLLVNLAEKLNKSNLERTNNSKEKLYYPVYLSLSWKWINEVENIQQQAKKLENKDNYEIVFLIYSIDESSIKWEERKELDKKLLKISQLWKVVVSSRNWYLNKYKDDTKEQKQKEVLESSQEIVEIQDLNKEAIRDYINKYFNNDIIKFNLTEQILKKLNGAWNNPLLLCMICEIVREWRIVDEKEVKIDLRNINITDIYFNIVKLRLLNWNINKPWRDILQKWNVDWKKKALNKKSQKLSQVGYRQIIEWEIFNFENLEEIIDDENLDIEAFNLLFRKSNDSLEYDFVHQSFKEYFAAKYIFEDIKNNKEFDYKIFLYQDLKRVDTNFLEMFWEFVKTDENIRERFLQEIDENESFFPEDIHYKILFLLQIFDIRKRNNYINLIFPAYSPDNVYEKFFWKKWNILAKYDLKLMKLQINDESTKVRCEAIRALWSVWWRDNIELIKSRINDESTKVRCEAIRALWSVWWRDNIELIKSRINDESSEVRCEVIRVLWSVYWRDDIELIKSRINDSSDKVKIEIFKAVRKKLWWKGYEFILKHLNTLNL